MKKMIFVLVAVVTFMFTVPAVYAQDGTNGEVVGLSECLRETMTEIIYAIAICNLAGWDSPECEGLLWYAAQAYYECLEDENDFEPLEGDERQNEKEAQPTLQVGGQNLDPSN